jgi:hypothetical protein
LGRCHRRAYTARSPPAIKDSVNGGGGSKRYRCHRAQELMKMRA